jgi:hypothetical protein
MKRKTKKNNVIKAVFLLKEGCFLYEGFFGGSMNSCNRIGKLPYRPNNSFRK